MGLFAKKKRPGTAESPSVQASPSDAHQHRRPAHPDAATQGRMAAVAMPDLRFSKIDFETDLRAIGSPLDRLAQPGMRASRSAGDRSSMTASSMSAKSAPSARSDQQARPTASPHVNGYFGTKMGDQIIPRSATSTAVTGHGPGWTSHDAAYTSAHKGMPSSSSSVRSLPASQKSPTPRPSLQPQVGQFVDQEYARRYGNSSAFGAPPNVHGRKASGSSQDAVIRSRPSAETMTPSRIGHAGTVPTPSSSYDASSSNGSPRASRQKIISSFYTPTKGSPLSARNGRQANATEDGAGMAHRGSRLPVTPGSTTSHLHLGSKPLATSSSSEGDTPSSSSNERLRGSSESNTSLEPETPSTDTDLFSDAVGFAGSGSGLLTRPGREVEKEERAHSRLSMSLDGELLKKLNVSEAKESQSVVPVRATAAPSRPPQLPAIQTNLGRQGHERIESNASTFSAMLMASRPGGQADRSIDDEKAKQSQGKQAAPAVMAPAPSSGRPARSRPSHAKTASRSSNGEDQDDANRLSMLDHASQLLRRVRESVPNLAQRARTVKPELVDAGHGWSCLGVGDVEPIDQHWSTVEEVVQVAVVVPPKEGSDHQQPTIEYRDQKVDAHYNDLFELLFTSTTPDVLTQLLSHLDIHDIKAVRQTCSAVRLTVGANRELILNQFLAPIGYRTWSYVPGSAMASRARQSGQMAVNAQKDPCPLSLSDLEGFIVSHDLVSEYAQVGQEFARPNQELDQGIARLARGTTRAYNRVLTRLRMQPVYKIPSTPTKRRTVSSNTSSPLPSPGGASMMSLSPSIVSPGGRWQQQPSADMSRHNSYYDMRKAGGAASDGFVPPLPAIPAALAKGSPRSPIAKSAHSPFASPVVTAPSTPLASTFAPASTLVSPWKPGRAALYRVWVPSKDPTGWLSDEELSACEQELYRAGIWSHLKRGDIVWDTAVGDRMNEGRYVFDGNYLRDLSYAHDVVGHLPSWLNVVLFCPSYWHNVLMASTPQPIVFMDVSPWCDQILDSLRLVQDQVDTFSGHGARYRIAKWLYRAAAHVTAGQIVSRINGGLEMVHDGWAGRIVVETDGTAESAKMLVTRCAGPDATPQQRAMLLAQVMGDANAARKMILTHDTNGMANLPEPGPRKATAIRRNVEAHNYPWAIMRERCRPGLIWIRPLVERASSHHAL